MSLPQRIGVSIQAQRLAQSLLVVDSHIDVPWRLSRRMEDVSRVTQRGDFDYPRACAGGLDVAFLAIYVPDERPQDVAANAVAHGLIDLVERLVRDHPDKFVLVTSPAEARSCLNDARVGLALGMENGIPLEGRLENLRSFHDRGIRYVTLAHSKSNSIADSCYDEARQWKGLSPFGREAVCEMNRLGIMVDVSHITDDAFFQVLELSRTPVIASHSSCRHFTPGWERNVSDEMIRQLAAAGGVVQVNFGSSFLDDEYRKEHKELRQQIDDYLEKNDVAAGSEQAEAYAEQFFKDHPLEAVGIGKVVDHIDHIVKLVGIDHVGLGSDFDGLGDTLPRGLRDVSEYPNLIRALLERGYGTADIGKICSSNVLRVWSAVLRFAAELQR